MALSTWRRSFKRSSFAKKTPTRTQRTGFRPYLELLEDRTVPSTITWTGANSAVDNNWSDALNWQGGVAPGSGDIANFTASGTQSFTSNVDRSFTVAGVTIDSTWGGAINANASLTVTGNLTLASGSFGGPGAVSIGGRASTWTGGTILPGAGGFTNKGTLTIDTSSGNLGLFTPVSGWLADGNANDSGLAGNNGTLQGGTTFGPGFTGQAFSYDGSTGSVDVPDSPSLDFTKEFTLSAWINPSALMQDPAQGGILCKLGFSTGESGYEFFVTGNNTQLALLFNTTGQPWPGNKFVVNLNTPIPLNQWTYVAGTYDGLNMNIYVNGTLVGSEYIGPEPIDTSAANFRISDDDNNNLHFAGLIDDASVYSEALTASEIQVIMNEQGAGTLTNNGTINLRGDNSLFLGNGVTLNDAKGAQFNLSADANISNYIGSTFTNAGTLQKTGGTGTSTIASPLNNTGTVAVHSGTLDVTAPVTQVSGTTLTAGSWSVYGSATVPATLTIGSAGSITTIGTRAYVTLSGLNSSFTNINGTGGLAGILAGGSFSILGGQSFTTAGNFSNAGTVTLTSGTLNITGMVAQLPGTSLTGGTWTVNANSNLNFAAGSNITTLAGAKVTLNGANSNFAALANLASSSSSSFSLLGGRIFTTAGNLSNTGTVTLTGGTLNVSGTVAQLSGTSLTGGTWTVNANSNLNFAAGSNITTLAGAKVTLNGANSNFAALANLASIGRTSSFSLLGDRKFTAVGSVTNSGHLTIGPGSTLTANGSFTQTSTASLTLQLGGTNNAPTFGQVVSTSGTVTLAGTLQVTSTVTPAVGSLFENLANGGGSPISGTFMGLAEGASFTVRHGSTTMTFQITYMGGNGNNVVIKRIS